jgi:hypothetical protein
VPPSLPPPPRHVAGPGCQNPAHGTATPRPWEARTHARACAPAPRCLAAPRPRHATPRPRHGLAVRGNHATRPQRCVHDAAKPSGHILKHALGACAHTRTASTHAHTHHCLPHQIWQPHQIRSETEKRAPPVEGKCRALPPGPAWQREREGRQNAGRPVKLSRPTCLASPRTEPAC